MTFFKIEAVFELKDLIHGSNGLQSAWFLDRFFLILIYTEVGAGTNHTKGISLNLAGFREITCIHVNPICSSTFVNGKNFF